MELNTSAAICDVNLEKSYLVKPVRSHFFPLDSIYFLQLDFSKEMVAWVKSEGYSLLDINLFPKPTLAVTTSKVKSLSFIPFIQADVYDSSSARNLHQILESKSPPIFGITTYSTIRFSVKVGVLWIIFSRITDSLAHEESY